MLCFALPSYELYNKEVILHFHILKNAIWDEKIKNV
jgi:hypothetical protein